jgi:hypothetical protein
MARCALLAVALLVGSGVASAQPTDAAQREAGEEFERGERAQARGLYHDAIAAYQKAFALVPHSNTLFNIAVCYEKLGQWSQSVDYYERYLSHAEDPVDGVEVRDKIRELRARSGPAVITPELPPETPAAPATPSGTTDARYNPFVYPPTPKPARWHAGLSYGFGFGDAPVERYLAHGGIRIAGRLELDAILGKFGKNDVAVGAMARLILAKSFAGGYAQPFLHGAATIGYAKSDDSSDAATKAPLGFEAGGGVRFGKQGRFELSGVMRVVQGGFDETSTVFDSYVNDATAFAIDLGIAFDIPLTMPSATGR